MPRGIARENDLITVKHFRQLEQELLHQVAAAEARIQQHAIRVGEIRRDIHGDNTSDRLQLDRMHSALRDEQREFQAAVYQRQQEHDRRLERVERRTLIDAGFRLVLRCKLWLIPLRERVLLRRVRT